MRAAVRFFLIPSSLALVAGWASAQNAISVPMEVEHNSNPELVPGGESVVRYRISPQFTMTRESGATRSVFSLGGVVERSSDTRISANRADPNVRYELQISAPTSVVTLNASLEESSSRTAEFEETGLVTEDSTLRTGIAGARWVKQLNDRNALELAGRYARLSYETPTLIGYSEVSAEAAYRIQPSEGNRYAVVGTAGRLNPNDDTGRSSRQGLMLNHERRFSPNWVARAGLGTVKTSGERVGRDTVGMVQVLYEGERLSSDVEWLREVAPSGSIGGYSLSQALRWGLTYPLTASTSLTSSVARTRALEIDGGNGRSVGFGLRSELTPFWSMTVRVEHVRATTATGITARGNAVGVGFVYAHPDL